MSLILTKPWARQPPGPARINAGNPLTARITHLLPLNGDPRELVTGARLTYGAGGANVATERGLALRGNGSSACASVPIDLSPYTTATVSFWLYWDAYSNSDNLALEYGANYVTNSGFLVDPSSGAPASGLFQASLGSAGLSNAISFARPSAAAWHHYVFRFDRTTGGLASTSVFVDAVAQSVTVVNGQDVTDNFGNNSLYIFSRNNTSLFGAGKMQNLAIRGGYLMTADEVRREYSFPWQLFAPLPRRIWAPSGSSAPVVGLAATGETAAFSATASGGTLAALAATGSTGAFAGTANSVSSVSLAVIGASGDFVGSAFSSAVVAAAVVGDTGTFAGSAGAGTSAALASTGASGAFIGAANSTTAVVLSATGSSGAFSGGAFVQATVALTAVGGTGAFSGATSIGSISAAIEIVRLASLITTTVLADSGICKSLPMASHISRRIDLSSAI